MKKHVEKYYAVKIGKLPKSIPYFAINPSCQTIPALFLTKSVARLRAKEDQGARHAKAVKVEVRNVLSSREYSAV